MFHLIRSRRLLDFLSKDLSTFLIALALCFRLKLGGFIPELACFMVVWYVLGFLVWLLFERRQSVPAGACTTQDQHRP